MSVEIAIRKTVLTARLATTVTVAVFLLLMTALVSNGPRAAETKNVVLNQAIGAYQSGKYGEAKKLLRPLVEAENSDAILINYYVSLWIFTLSKPNGGLNTDKDFASARKLLSSIAEAGHLEAMIEVSRHIVTSRYVRPESRERYIDDIIKKGGMEGYILRILSRDLVDPLDLQKKPIVLFLKSPDISTEDRSFWNSFLSFLKKEWPIDYRSFDTVFRSSHAVGDGRVYFLGCRLSVTGIINSPLSELSEYCAIADQFGYAHSLSGVSSRVDSVELEGLKSDVDVHGRILWLSENKKTTAYLATKWCKRVSDEDFDTCIDFAINNHYRCIPNTNRLINAREFAESRAYDMCRTKRFRKLKEAYFRK